MPLGFTFTGDSLSPSSSGPALGGTLGISIQGITTGGMSAASMPVGGATDGLGGNMSPLILIALAVAIVLIARERRR